MSRLCLPKVEGDRERRGDSAALVPTSVLTTPVIGVPFSHQDPGGTQGPQSF